jgi:hypothetical protein
MSRKLEEQQLAYQQWMLNLKVGDAVEVQDVWLDNDYLQGQRLPGKVIKVTERWVKIEYTRPSGSVCWETFQHRIGGNSFLHLAPVGVEVRSTDNGRFYLAGKPKRRKTEVEKTK